MDRPQTISSSIPSSKKSTEEIDTRNSQFEADFYISLGDKFWQQKKLTETVEAYRQAIELETKSPQVYYRMAEALKRLGNFEEAAFYYRLAVSVKDDRRSGAEEPLKFTDMAGETGSKLMGEGMGASFSPEEQTARIYLEQAGSYLEERQWESAISACKDALKVFPDLAEAYKIWGSALQRQGKISDAMGHYAQALTLQPDSPEIYANLGSIYAQKKRWSEALSYYQKAIELDPDFAGVYRNLAKVWTQLGEIEKADEARKKAIELEPEKIDTRELTEIGDRAAAEQNLEDALEYYRQALRRQPDSLELYRSLAGVLEELKRWQDAAACYRKIAELERLQHNKSVQLPPFVATTPPALTGSKEPDTGSRSTPIPDAKTARPETNSTEAWVHAGNAFVEKQQWQQAIDAYDRALQIDSQRPDIYRQMAKIAAKLGRKDVAADYWYRALDIEGKQGSPKEYLQLGHLWCELECNDRAVDCYRRALQLQPTLNEAYHHFGKILAEAGNLKELVELYKLAVTYNPENVEHYYHLGEACRHQGDWQIAVACYQKALTIDPKSWETHHILGDSFLKQERYAEASGAYRRAIELNPNSFWSCHNLGYTLFKLENCEEAFTFLEQAIALKSDFFWTHYNIGDVCIQLERWERATTAFVRVLELQPSFSPARQKLQYVEERKGNTELELAFQLYLEAIERDPNDTDSYQKALEIHPERLHLQLEFARILQQQGRIEESISRYQQAIALDPQNIDIYQNLGKLFCQQGNPAKARLFYQHGLNQNLDRPEAIAKLNALISQLST
jgi:O-antigen biosynthesis protein